MANFRTPRGLRGLVRRAAAHLDRVRPGWYRRVKLTELDMASPCKCVLGQVFGGRRFSANLEALDAPALEEAFFAVYGFTFDPDSDDETDLCEAFWKDEIRERRAAKA